MLWKFEVAPQIKEFELNNNPVIVTVNKFDEESAMDFRNKVSLAHNTGQKIIPVLIDSYGGQVYSLMSMISSIKNAELPIATIVQGKAMSCGALLFSFGADNMRFIDKDATIMIHDVSSGQYGKVEELKANAKESARLNDKVYKMMAQNIGKEEDYFIKKIHEKGHADWFLSANECKEINLATHIRVPKFNIKLSVDIDFI
jgi:ATP-dependent Clp protease, protease subunit